MQRRRMPMLGWLLAGAGVASGLLVAGEPDTTTSAGAAPGQVTAREKYILFCAGCHGYEGEGGGGAGGMAPVPPLNRQLGVFLRDPLGRAYMVNVGGVATAGMDDAETAIVLNYLLLELGEQSLPAGFRPYTAAEVRELRNAPIQDAVAERTRMRERLLARGYELPPYQWDGM